MRTPSCRHSIFEEAFAAFLISMTFAAGALPQQAPAPQDVEQRQGPFTVAGERFAVVLYNKRLVDPSGVGFSETLAALEIRDPSGAVQYGRTFPYQVQDGKFQQTISASAKLLSGNGPAGLLIRYIRQPAPPGSGESWQVFQLKDGKLAVLDPLVFAAREDRVELRVWAGNFYVTVPLRVDWQQGRLMPPERCFETAGGPGLSEVGCEMRVEAERKPGNADFTSVRLFSEAREDRGIPRHVVIKKDSKIEYLAAKAIVSWGRNGDEMLISLSDVWLKVLIDDSEENVGWIHTGEDFSAAGLPAGSPVSNDNQTQ